MAWLVGDGFDYYAAAADIARSVWDSVAGTPIIGTAANYPGRFLPGQCLLPGNTTVLQKTFGSNETTVFACFAYYRPGALSGTAAEGYIEFRDGATAQVTIVLQSNGDLVVKRGDRNGTVVATYAGAFAQDVWTHFQVRILIDPTAGTVTVRKNGATGDTFTATGLNTRATANTQATVVALGNGTATLVRFDDVLIFSGAGAAPNSFVGDVRAICLQPSADTAQKAFSATLTSSIEGDNQFTTAAIPANELHTGGVQTSVAGTGALYPSRGGTVSKVSVTQSGAYAGKVRCAIYADDGPGGGPGTLIASSTELTAPAAGTVDFTFPAGTQLASGRGYFFAFLTDATWTIGTIGVVLGHWKVARTYASGFPTTMPTLTADSVVRAPQAKVTLTGSCVAVSELLGNGDTDYVFSATPGALDLYDMGDLPITPTAIIGVVTKAFVKKSDAAARQGQVQLRSGATDVTSPDAPLSTTYTYVSRVDPVDPATGVAWTLAGVNAIQVGPKVTS